MTVTFEDSDSSAADASTYTFSGMTFGTAYAGRRLVVAVITRSGAAESISSVTIGGIAATALKTKHNDLLAPARTICAIYAATVPTGTSGDVVVTCSGTMVRCAVGLYNSPTGFVLVSSDDDEGNDPLTASVSAIAGGFTIGAAYGGGGNTPAFAWTGLTENVDVALDTTNAASSALKNSSAAETVNVSADFSASAVTANLLTLAVASFSGGIIPKAMHHYKTMQEA
jgi:hypothetical protein